MAKQNKVAVNLAQDFTDAEKEQARANIGALGSADVLTANRYNWSSPTVPNSVKEIKFNQKGVSTAQIMADSTDLGSTVPLPSLSSDEGKVPVAYYRDGRGYYLLERVIPTHTAQDAGKVLSVDSSNGLKWNTLSIPSYTAGSGIDITNDQISWEYTVGRNLHINQNNQIQTNLPGGLYDAPTSQSNSFAELTDSSGNKAKFAGAYRLSCRHNPNDTYELALKYTASGMTGTITFTGTETVIMADNSMSIHPAAYISEYAYYTPSRRFGADSGSTIFDPSVHKAIIYQGVAQIGPTSNTQIAIWQDNGAIKISFTSIEVGRVGSTL